MNITLIVDKDEASVMLATNIRNRDWLQEQLDIVKTNIKTLTLALNPSGILETMVLSSTDRSKSYLVTLDVNAEPYHWGTPNLTGYGYKCTCPSFEYKSGVDSFGWCKHIKRVIDEGRFIDRD